VNNHNNNNIFEFSADILFENWGKFLRHISFRLSFMVAEQRGYVTTLLNPIQNGD
jgi:hypothetical protein